MNLLQLIERSLAQRKLSTALTVFSVALGMMLVCAILVARREVEEKYLRQAKGFELVVGPTGSPLQLVLNAVYHVEQSPGLVPYSALEQLRDQPEFVRLAVPYALGDSFRGYRVVATTEDVFSKHFPVPAGEGAAKLAAGRPFVCDPHALEVALDDLRAGRVGHHFGEGPGAEGHDHGDDGHDHADDGHDHADDGHDHAADDAHDHADDEAHDHDHDHDHDHGADVAEAVLGAEVARRLGIEIGDRIEPSHNLEGAVAHAHHHDWEVVGILKETGTPIDRVVLINLDSFYRIPEHAGGLIPTTNEPGLSSILLFARGAYGKLRLYGALRNRSDLQVADVATQIRKLLDIVGGIREFFMVMAWLVVVTGVVGIMVAIYNTMNDRRREIAIMRALGAHRRGVFMVIVGEALALGTAGAVVGMVFGHGLLWAAASRVEDMAGLRLDPTRVLPEELLAAAAVILVSALAGFVPAFKAYRTDVARNLAPLS